MDRSIQGHFKRTQQSIVGQMVSSLMTHELFEHSSLSDQTWGDYAVYDCVGCHQTLYKEIRGNFAQPGRVPGRPQSMLWAKPSELAAKRLDVGGLLALQFDLDKELNVRPFGNAKSIQHLYAEYSARGSNMRGALVQASDRSLAYAEADEWVRSYLRERYPTLGNEWVAKQVFWTLEAYFDDLAKFKKRFPSEIVKDLEFAERFKELELRAPAVSELVSCDSNRLTSEPADHVAFYNELRLFIEAYLGDQL